MPPVKRITNLQFTKSLLVSAILIVGALSLGFTLFSGPLADDFCRAAWPDEWQGALEKVRHTYLTWTGRWAAVSIYAFVFPHIPMTSATYPLLMVQSGVIWFTIFYISLHIFYGNTLSEARKAIFSSILCAVYWTGMPHPGDTWYWLTGTVEWQIPMLLFALSMLVLTGSRIRSGGRLERVTASFIGAGLGFLVTGFNELCGLLLLGTCTIATLLAFIRRRPDMAAIYLFAGIVAAAGVLITVGAPGNTLRIASDFPNSHDPIFAIRTLIVPGLNSPIEWLGDARLLALSLFLLTSLTFVNAQPEWTKWQLPLPSPFSSMAAFVPLVGFTAVAAGLLAVAYAQGSNLPQRALNILYAVLLVGWIAALIPLGQIVRKDIYRQGEFVRGAHMFAAIAFPITLLIAPNTLRAAYDLPDVVSRWHPSVISRDTEIRQLLLDGNQDIIIESTAPLPKLYLGGSGDITSDPTDWRNVCVAQYYGVRSIAIRTSDNNNGQEENEE
jgi:hypothetical protein